MSLRRGSHAVTALVLGSTIWGLTWIPLKYFATLGLEGHGISLTAYAAVALISLPMLWHERHRSRPEWALLLAIGLFFGAANVALTIALMLGSVTRVMMLFFLLPAWGVLGGALVLGERITIRRGLAALLSLGGVFAILGGPAAFTQPWSVADAMAIAAGLAYAAGGIANRKARQLPIVSRTLSTFVGCALVALLGLAWHNPPIPPLPTAEWLWLAAFAFVWIMGTTVLTTHGVTHVDASRAAVLQVTELLVAVASAVLIGGERLGWVEAIGGAMIFLAALTEAVGTSEPKEA